MLLIRKGCPMRSVRQPFIYTVVVFGKQLLSLAVILCRQPFQASGHYLQSSFQQTVIISSRHSRHTAIISGNPCSEAHPSSTTTCDLVPAGCTGILSTSLPSSVIFLTPQHTCDGFLTSIPYSAPGISFALSRPMTTGCTDYEAVITRPMPACMTGRDHVPRSGAAQP